MKYGCKHNQNKIGVLIAQLGTPCKPTPECLKPYLKRFLGDPRVIEKPRWLWYIILNFIILNLRPKRSARLYARIWTKKGSPLLVYTKSVTKKLEEKFAQLSERVVVTYGMRYSKPSLECAIDKLIKQGCETIVLFNMYPQYSATTVASNYDAVFKHLLKRRVVPTLKVVNPYFNNPNYILPLANKINESLKTNIPERIVLSYHGIPKSYIDKGDSYCCQCVETTKYLRKYVNFPSEKIIHTFQSRFGRDPWLTPYTDVTIEELAKEGIKNISVFCPGFPTDCLETLDELGNEAKELFEEHGGKHFELIPCLNDDDNWVEGIYNIVHEEIKPQLELKWDPEKIQCPVFE